MSTDCLLLCSSTEMELRRSAGGARAGSRSGIGGGLQMAKRSIDLRSDTVTKPSAAMRRGNGRG